jgi:hypothetical protein
VDSHNSIKHSSANVAKMHARDLRDSAGEANFADEPELTVADDVDLGGDPYNSTGRHVIIKSKLNLED